MSNATAILHRGKDAAIRRFHPWVFSGAIRQWQGHPVDGDIVDVLSADGDFLGTGHFQDGSIQIRILSFIPRVIDHNFWVSCFHNAFQLRQNLGLVREGFNNCYRLVHGEGDGLPGLIVDVYGHTAVVQCHSIGMHRQRTEIAEALQQVLGPGLEAVYDKSSETLPSNYATGITSAWLYGSSSPGFVKENGLDFWVDWETGQKTGFFLDQRDNRQLVRQCAEGKTVLNAFCYTGGFSVYALHAGAAHVDSVDSSARAIEIAVRNAAAQSGGDLRHQAHTADVMKFLQASPSQHYDLMVVDPPAFAKSVDKRHNAVQAYKRLNAMAISKIKPGGLIFTFSCSQVVDRTLFYHTIVAAALEAARPVRVLHHLRQPPDHPVSLFHPEGEYLKGLVLEIG
jgi:23S rRNA (cytosine1962-C5)-methyltransferase